MGYLFHVVAVVHDVVVGQHGLRHFYFSGFWPAPPFRLCSCFRFRFRLQVQAFGGFQTPLAYNLRIPPSRANPLCLGRGLRPRLRACCCGGGHRDRSWIRLPLLRNRRLRLLLLRQCPGFWTLLCHPPRHRRSNRSQCRRSCRCRGAHQRGHRAHHSRDCAGRGGHHGRSRQPSHLSCWRVRNCCCCCELQGGSQR